MSRFGLSLLLAIALAAICSATPSVPSVTPASPVTSAETPSTPSPESPTPGSPPPSPPPTDTFTESDLIPDIGAVDLHLSGNVIARAICTGCGSQAEQLRRDIAAILDISHKAMTTLDYQQPAGRFEAVIRLFDTVRAGRVVGAKTLANELAQHLEDSDANLGPELRKVDSFGIADVAGYTASSGAMALAAAAVGAVVAAAVAVL